MRFLKRRFLDLRIEVKTVLSMVSISLVVAGAVGLLCTVFYTNQFKAQSAKQTEDTMDSTVLTTYNTMNDLYRSLIYVLSNKVFGEIYAAEVNGTVKETYTSNYITVNSLFSTFINSHELVDNVLLITDEGTVYSTYDVGFGLDAETFALEMGQRDRIAWLAARQNPLPRTTGRVVTICFPLAYQFALTFATGSEPSMMFIMYLNADKLALSMERTNRTAFSNIYLADENGVPLSLMPGHALYETVTEAEYVAQLVEGEGRRSFDLKGPDGVRYGVTTDQLGISDLRLVTIVSYEELLSGVRNIQKMALVAVVVTFLISLLIARGLATSLTTPIKRLLEQVQKVRGGDYELGPVTIYKDEMHTLDEALCDMGSTIRAQMEDIRETERGRLAAEMAAMSEQINPHFLYNTLDCIHWEILGGNSENASDMVESLGVFLRLSLSGGRELLTLPETLEHTKQYLHIMSYRFASKIHFAYSIPPELDGLMLPRMVLQPLAENAIMHGFGAQTPDPCVTRPSIRVRVYRDGGCLRIDMEDNGRGIDVERAQQCLREDSTGTGHVGLNNVLGRLRYRFGEEARMEFSTIPYYKNCVSLVLPYEGDEAAGEDVLAPMDL